MADLESLEGYLLAGVLTSTAAAALAGAWCVRATRIHFTILTLAFAQLVHALFVGGAVYRPLGDYGKGLFYVGYGGLYIRRFTIFGSDPTPERFIPTFYYIILLAFFLVLGVLWRVSRSPFGISATPRTSASASTPGPSSSVGSLPTVIMIRAARDASASHAPSPCVGGTRGSDR